MWICRAVKRPQTHLSGWLHVLELADLAGNILFGLLALVLIYLSVLFIAIPKVLGCLYGTLVQFI